MKNIFKSVIVSILTFEAKLLLRRTKPKIIAITGSVGKTSTKDAVYHVLRKKISARKSEKSYNSEIGVPLSVLGLDNAWQNPFLWLKNIIDGMLHALLTRKYPEVLVLEMGVDRPGDMKKLTEWIKPDIVILTALPEVPVHVEFFSSPEEVISEKLELVNSLKDDGILIYNNDDQRVREVAQSIRQKAIGYARYSETDYVAKGDEINYAHGVPTGQKFTILKNHQEVNCEVKETIGVSSIYNFAAAMAVAECFSVTMQEAAEWLKDFDSPPGRMRLIPGIKDTLIIDDTYNSSPTALNSALSTLKETKGFRRKIAVLGDMLELGKFSVEAHRSSGVQVAECADILITVGVRSRIIAESANGSGMKESNIIQYDEAVRAGRELQTLIQPGDLILVKGSQSMRMEKIVEDIMAKPEEADTTLVRQSSFWKKH